MNANEKLVRDLNQGRIANVSSDLLFPILTKHREEVLEQMCAQFRAGEKDLIAYIAKLAYIGELMAEIHNVQRRGELAATKLNNNGKT